MTRAGCATAAALLLAAGAGCGETERLPPPPASSPQRVALDIAVDPDGDGRRGERTAQLRCPSREHEDACRRALRLPPAAFEPVRGDLACTEIYGGPQRARLEGAIGRRRVDAEFTRVNGCEIARYDAVAFLLELAR